MRRLALLVVLTISSIAHAQPAEVAKWTGKLGDPKEAERALAELEQLGDPAAIDPIGKAWLAQGKPVRWLAVAISLAQPLTPAEAKTKFFTSYEKTGRPASWPAVLPYITRAADEIDATNPRSVDNAQRAAEALGMTKLEAAIAPLAKLLALPSSKKTIAAQVAAARALGAIDTAKPKASAALAKALDRTFPADKKDEAYAVNLAIVGASLNALGELRDPTAATPVIIAMYRHPELFMQARRTLVAFGSRAGDELREVLRGKHAAVNKVFTAEKLDKSCSKGAACQPISSREFYAAIVLGDLGDMKSVPDLLAILAKPALPTYYTDGAPSPNTQHNGAFDSLRKLVAVDAAAPLQKIWIDPKADQQDRTLAASTYGFVARSVDPGALDALAKIFSDNTAEDELRMTTAEAYARIAKTKESIPVVMQLAAKYLDAAAKAKDKRVSTAYVGFARMFQTHAARIVVGIECKEQINCFTRVLAMNAKTAKAKVAAYIKDLDAWSTDELAGLVDAMIERAMLELAKSGAAAASETDTLLANLDVPQSRIVRQAIMLALRKVAPNPCTTCDAKLATTLSAWQGKTTQADLAMELQILRSSLAAR